MFFFGPKKTKTNSSDHDVGVAGLIPIGTDSSGSFEKRKTRII